MKEHIESAHQYNNHQEPNIYRHFRPEFIRAVGIVNSVLEKAIEDSQSNSIRISAFETALLTLAGLGVVAADNKEISRRKLLGILGLAVVASLIGCEKKEQKNDPNDKISDYNQRTDSTPTKTPLVIIRQDLFSDLKIPIMANFSASPIPTATPTATPTVTPTPTAEAQIAREDPVPVEPPIDYQPPPEVKPGGENKVILTFDDSGPQAYTILDIMAKYGAKGIFFPTGTFAASDPGVIQRMYDEGHMICNHTYGHADLTTLSADGVRFEIQNGAGVGTCNLLRPPYGAHNSFVDSIAAELGYQIYMWDIDTRDWARRYAGGDQEILNIALSEAYPGAVILMHMHVDNTVYALPGIIEGLQKAGYTLSW